MNILIVGDSCSANSGFDSSEDKVWYHHIPKQHSVTNLSENGHSNYKIFVKATAELLTNQRYDLIIIQWSGLMRLNLHEGRSIYNNIATLTVDSGPAKFNKFYKTWRDNFLHPRIELLEFLTLISSMASFLKMHNLNYIFVKGSENFLDNLTSNEWNNCSDDFLDVVLHRHTLPDWEIEKYYLELRNLYVVMNNLTESRWVNLTQQDWFSNKIDLADDKLHGGVLTNKMFYNQVDNFIKTIGINL